MRLTPPERLPRPIAPLPSPPCLLGQMKSDGRARCPRTIARGRARQPRTPRFVSPGKFQMERDHLNRDILLETNGTSLSKLVRLLRKMLTCPRCV